MSTIIRSNFGTFSHVVSPSTALFVSASGAGRGGGVQKAVDPRRLYRVRARCAGEGGAVGDPDRGARTPLPAHARQLLRAFQVARRVARRDAPGVARVQDRARTPA